MNADHRNNLRRLALLMRRRNNSHIPVNDALLDCFDWVIRPREAEYLLAFGLESRTRAEAEKLWRETPFSGEESRSGDESAAFNSAFRELLEKGLIWTVPSESPDPVESDPVESKSADKGDSDKGDPEERFELAPILLGWFELQLCRGKEGPEDREFARRLDTLFDDWAKLNTLPGRTLINRIIRRGRPANRIMAAAGAEAPGQPEEKTPVSGNSTGSKTGTNRRTIPVGRSVDAGEHRVITGRTAMDLVETHGKKGHIALVHCFCRHWRKLTHDPCRFSFSPESCLAIGPFSDHIVRYGFGRSITLDQAMDVVASARKAGAVHTIFYDKDDLDRGHLAMCNCCWDCCGILGSYNRGILPLKFRAGVIARIADPDACVACGKCENHCPVQALRLEEKAIRLEPDLCIGCGQCMVQCPAGVFSLDPQERDVILPLVKPEDARLPLHPIAG